MVRATFRAILRVNCSISIDKFKVQLMFSLWHLQRYHE